MMKLNEDKFHKFIYGLYGSTKLSIQLRISAGSQPVSIVACDAQDSAWQWKCKPSR